MIALAFYRASSGSFADKLIAWGTRGPYCHVELWLDGPLHSARCFSSMMGVGTRIATIDLTAADWQLIVIDANLQEQDACVAWCEKHIGERYDWPAALGFVFPFGEHARHEAICSEACGRALEAATREGRRWKRAGKKPWRISPNSLCRLALT